ncbi:MAG: rod shape-determining protein MreD [Deltaproteobacteria bacterium]|jgi:rod shape-determining protein MreD|nr:rod shape-determining protein MreD [Deltaproteobacteria bacterium]
MLIVLFLLLGILSIVLQTTLLQLLPPWLGKPDILFLLVVYISCRTDLLRGLVTILLLGFLMDVFSGVFLGLYPVIYLLVFAFIKGISRRVAINDFAYQVPLAVISYLFVSIGMFLFSYALGPETLPGWSWGTILLQLLLLAVVGVPLFGILGSILDRYRSFSAAGRLPGSRTTNRFKR